MDSTLGSSPRPGSSQPTLQRLVLIVGLIALAIIARLLPHPTNFTPIGAVALFAGATLGSRLQSVLIVICAMLISDAYIGMHMLLPVIYGCLLFNVWLGWRIQGHTRPLNVVGSSLVGSVVFFVVTNFACWVSFYDHTLSGLTSCYVLAIPFFHNTVLGDLFFTTALFGTLALAERRFPMTRMTSTKA